MVVTDTAQQPELPQMRSTAVGGPAENLSSAQLLALHRHLTQSLLTPVCPDVRLKAFNRIYSVHRIFLVQSTFFNSLLDGGFREAKTKAGVWKAGPSSFNQGADSVQDDAVELYFDDPNITRPAFEYCLASLYGAAPSLVLPSWCCPTLDHPLTSHFQQQEGQDQPIKSPSFSTSSQMEQPPPEKAQHPATPRFLLSLIASATYIGIPSVAAQAVTLILCSITPYTVSHYLRFSLGWGITGAVEAQDRQEGAHALWDWELEGPAWGLETLSKECTADVTSACVKPECDEKSLQGEDIDDDEEGKAGSDISHDSSTSDAGAKRSPSSFLHKESTFSHQGRHYYGAQSDKIGEACACWLLRWGADVLFGEDQLQPDDEGQDAPSYSSLFTLPRGEMPIPPTVLATTSSVDLRQALAAPPPAVWCSPRLGGIPSDWARIIISSDSFWIRSEWDRYDVARRMVTLRRGRREDFVEADEEFKDEVSSRGSIDSKRDFIARGEKEGHLTKAPSTASSRASAYEGEDDEDEQEYQRLFSEGIYYTHMTFEELSAISSQTYSRNGGGASVPINVLQSALWAQSELKNMILSRDRIKKGTVKSDEEDEPEEAAAQEGLKAATSKAAQAERELGLVSSKEDFDEACQWTQQRRSHRRSEVTALMGAVMLGGMRPLKVMGMTSKTRAVEDLLDKRFFAVPCDDTVRIGENLSSLVTNGGSSARTLAEEGGGATGIAAVLDHQTLHIMHDTKRSTMEEYFGVQNAVRRGIALGQTSDKRKQIAASASDWTGYEPMRLGVEFYGVDKLREKERMYSPSFFYAGSIWNLYLQIIKKPKGLQLGIYLHRQNCNDSLPNPSYPSEMMADLNLGADGAGAEPRTPGRREGNGPANVSFYTLTSSPSNNASSAQLDTTNATTPISQPSIARPSATPSGTQPRPSTLSPPLHSTASLTPSPTSNCIVNSNQQPSQYMDQRRILRAYFSVHCPSAMGTSLTRFSSRPDNFSLSQSWGWKSSSLLGAVYLADNRIGSAESRISSTFRCIVTVGLV